MILEQLFGDLGQAFLISQYALGKKIRAEAGHAIACDNLFLVVPVYLHHLETRKTNIKAENRFVSIKVVIVHYLYAAHP